MALRSIASSSASAAFTTSYSHFDQTLGGAKGSSAYDSKSITHMDKQLNSVVVSTSDEDLLAMAGKRVFDEVEAGLLVAKLIEDHPIDGVRMIKFIIAHYVKSGTNLEDLNSMKVPKSFRYIQDKFNIETKKRGDVKAAPEAVTMAKFIAALPKTAVAFRMKTQKPSAGVSLKYTMADGKTLTYSNAVFCSPEAPCLMLLSATELFKIWLVWGNDHHTLINTANRAKGKNYVFSESINVQRWNTRFIPTEVRACWTAFFYEDLGMDTKAIEAEMDQGYRSLGPNWQKYVDIGFPLPMMATPAGPLPWHTIAHAKYFATSP